MEFHHIITGTADVIIIELNLLVKKDRFLFKDNEYESKLCRDVFDDDLKHYLIYRVDLKGVRHHAWGTCLSFLPY